MKKGDLFEGKVARTEFPCKGIVYINIEENGGIEKKKVMVKDALEGQEVRLSISKKKKDRLEGRLLEVLKPSEAERESPCPHFGLCGGCRYQTLPYEQQLNLKKRQVEKLIENSGLDFSIEKIYGSPVENGYRNKMEYSFGDEYKEGPLSLGMHKKSSFYDIVPLTECRIVHPDFNLLITVVREYFREKGAAFYHRMRHTGFLRHLVLRRSAKTGEILVNLVTSSQGDLDAKEFVGRILSLTAGSLDKTIGSTNQSDGNAFDDMNKESGKSSGRECRFLEGRIAGILHTINDSLADVVQSDETRILYGKDFFYEYLEDLRFKITPFSFFQTNTLGAEVLYGKVREYVGETRDKLIYDLYSGTGTIAQMLAPVAKQAVGVEIVEEAVESAKENAVANHLDNCRFIAGDVLKVVDSLTEKPDILVLDPPRDGINPKALKKIIGFGVEEMVYVSCKPTSLMRDLTILKEAGYQVKKACLVDMFPGTVHVESVVKLTRAGS